MALLVLITLQVKALFTPLDSISVVALFTPPPSPPPNKINVAARNSNKQNRIPEEVE
jgi:hypothetical protein